MEIKDHTLDISSYHDELAPSQSDSVVHEQQTSSMDKASAGTTAAAISSRMVDDLAYLGIVIISIFIMLVAAILFLIVFPLAVVSTSIIIPVMIICLVLLYWITNIDQFAKCDDYSDIDDTYDTELGSYWRELVVWMAQLTSVLIAEMLVYLAIFGIDHLHLRKLCLVHLPVWKWFLIGIIFLVYFGLWCLSRLSVHKIRECLPNENVFVRVYVLHIYEALLGLAIWGSYFLVEFLVFKIVAPSIRPKILGLPAHKWAHALVFVFIGVNVGRILSASIVALSQKKHYYHGKIDYNRQNSGRQQQGENGCLNIMSSEKIKKSMGEGCKHVKNLLFKEFDNKKCSVYVVIGLRRSISVVLIAIWLLTSWTSHFVHHLRPSPDTVWVIRVGTVTLYCLLILSILWLLKNSIMLWWEYRSMYHKFYDQVLEVGTKLYLLGMICGQDLDVLRVGRSNINGEEKEGTEKRIGRVVEKAKIILVPEPTSKTEGQNEDDQRQPGIYAIRRMVKYFLRAEDVFKRDMNESIQKLTKKWRQTHSYHPDEENSRKLLESDHIKQAYGTELDGRDFDILLRQIRAEKKELGAQVGDFESWMKSSYRSCYNMANTLASAERLAIYLNRSMIVITIPIVIGIWLVMFTRSTKPVAVFTAPVLAVSFIFGDTISTMFKGIIFSYVIHPYDIGDLCIIKTIMYEVKRIDFWQTTFLEVETNEVVLYPNSALFGESIINKKSKNGSLETLDRLRFVFESDTDLQNIVKLTNEFEDYFLKEQSIEKHQVEVKYDSEDTRQLINLTINFKHKVKDDSGVLNSDRCQLTKRNKEELKNHIIGLCKRYPLQIVALDEKEKSG